MSEKRFTWDGDILFDNFELRELGNCLEARDIADLLNKQYDENEQLKEENEKLVQNKCLSCELVNLQTREIDKLKDENEQLKQILENLDLNEKNDTVKMIDGKAFMRM